MSTTMYGSGEMFQSSDYTPCQCRGGKTEEPTEECGKDCPANDIYHNHRLRLNQIDLTTERKQELDKAIDLLVKDFGDVLRRLADE